MFAYVKVLITISKWERAVSRYSLAEINHCCFPCPRWSSIILYQEKLLSISSQQCCLLTIGFPLFAPYWGSFGPHIQTQAEENFFFALVISMENFVRGHHLPKELKEFYGTKGLLFPVPVFSPEAPKLLSDLSGIISLHQRNEWVTATLLKLLSSPLIPVHLPVTQTGGVSWYSCQQFPPETTKDRSQMDPQKWRVFPETLGGNAWDFSAPKKRSKCTKLC